MSTKFVTDKEIAFVNSINRELVQNVVGEEIHYYAIVTEKTRIHRLYQEAVKKVWAAPVKVNALVMYDNPTVKSTNIGVDSVYTIDVYFHQQELVDRNVVPREGDFVEYGSIFYEIVTCTQPQVMFGQINNKVMTKCTCVVSREGQFAAGSDSTKDRRNVHPVEQVIGVNR